MNDETCGRTGERRVDAAPLRVVVPGIAGSGITTIGTALANRLGVFYVDGDSLHPPENITKMSAGTPLADEDRPPWLAELRADSVPNAASLSAAQPFGAATETCCATRVMLGSSSSMLTATLRFGEQRVA